MRVKKDRFRITLIVGKVAVKLPRIHIWKAWQTFWFWYKSNHGRLGFLKNECFKYTTERSGSLKQFLFKGIANNWREFCFYRRFKHRFTQPTYFSFFGLINVQRAGQQCQMKEADLWHQLLELTEDKAYKDAHTFINPANFCVCNGQLKILDYGNPHTQEVLVEYADKIVEQFDINYDWEERKKRVEEKTK